MTRNEAAALVNDAYREAKANDATKDEQATGVTITLYGEKYEYKFQSSHRSLHARRDELAVWRLALVNMVLAMPEPAEAEVVEEQPEPEPGK